MKKCRKALYCLIISFISANALSIPSSYAASKTQLFKPSRAGRISTVVANTILNGVTSPKSTDGIEGDFYIDTRALLFYGPKGKSRWPAPTSIRGPQGQMGPSGSNGTDAKPSSNVMAAGAQGLTGATGPKGEQGLQGNQGVTGPAGPKGETGATGSAGANGIAGASGTPGATGAPGPAGPQGAVGAQGVRGADGATGSVGSVGATGATGPSSAHYGPVNFSSPIQGIVGSAQTSSNFGTFEAGKSYVIRIQIQTFNVDRLISTYPLSFELFTQGATPSYSVSYSVANGSSFNLAIRRDEVSINAEVILDGTQVPSAYALSVTITCGSNTGSFPITLMGRYHSITVGQVTQTS